MAPDCLLILVRKFLYIRQLAEKNIAFRKFYYRETIRKLKNGGKQIHTHQFFFFYVYLLFMIDLKSLKRLIDQIADERGIAPDSILGAIEGAIAAAYKKEYGERGEIVKAKIDLKTGKLKFWQIKIVVDETTVAMDKEKRKETKAAEESEII